MMLVKDFICIKSLDRIFIMQIYSLISIHDNYTEAILNILYSLY